MGKFLDHLIIGVIWVGVIAAGCWFGGPLIWKHIQAAEQAVQTVKVQAGALNADATAATRAQKSCADEIAAAARAQAAIAAVSRPAPVVAGQSRPMISADQIRAMIQ